MKYLLLLLLSISILRGHAQTDATVNFRQAVEALENLHTLQYDAYREINNYKENYFAKNSGTAYFEFDDTKEGKLQRCQLRSDKMLQVYNGTEFFSLFMNDKTYEGGKSKASALSNTSLLYNSMATLKVALPLIAADASIPKSANDTTVEGKKYLLLKFGLYKKTMEFPGGFGSFDADVTKYYDILVDPASRLPYMIIDRNSIMKDQYYTKTIFTNITTKPSPPEATSWFISGHEGYTLKENPKRIPMIAAGSKLPGWSLALMSATTGDSLQSASLNGKKTILEFWIKNCGYCMAAFPEVKELQSRYGKEINVVSVNAYEERKDVAFFYDREKPSYKMLYGGEKLANQLGIFAYPAVIVLDEEGVVLYARGGFEKEAVIKAMGK